jgi:MinD superfamily P-loop ATPase
MKIAIASGKGGTGKTTVATNLARLAADQGYHAVYVDCDVEAPNGHLFLRPEITETIAVTVSVPDIDASRCNNCGACARFCQYHALLCLPEEVLLFPELCHSCGGCRLVCPKQAIDEIDRPIGQCQTGRCGQLDFVSGCLNIGEAKSPPLIHEVKKRAPEADITFIDAPPGTSCPVVESLRNSDFVLLVTEPTPFGLHDLTLAAEMVELLGIPCGVVINRSAENDQETLDYCQSKNLPVLARFPDDRKAAEAYSRGELVTRTLCSFERPFTQLLDDLLSSDGPTRFFHQRCQS